MNTGSRVHPHANHSYHEDLEFELPYTLEQARWSEHRLKIGLPALAVVKLERRQKISDANALQKEQVQFIRQKLHVKECARFVQDKSSKSKVPACHCGEVENKHYYALQARQPILGQDVSYGVNNLSFQMEGKRASKTLMVMLPTSSASTSSSSAMPKPYDPRADIELHACNSFGKIEFLEDDVRRRKPAKYVRVADSDSADDVITLMMNYWRIGEPKLADLVITVIGGAKNFKLDGRMREIFNRGLMKAAKTTSAWLISSGCNMGVMKAVGDALREGQSFDWGGAEGAAHQVRGIGIAPWGYVDQRESLVDFSGEGSWPAHYKPYTKIQHGRPVSLNPDHTHFILVDDGKRGKYGGVADFRAKLERKISSSEKDGGLGIPLVLLVVEGGTDAINDCFESLKHNVPAVICEGTGRAANIIAYAYNNHKLDIRSNKRVIKQKHIHYLKLLILQAYGSTWSSNTREENDKICDGLVEKVLKCCEKERLITIFNMNHHQALDRAILNALLKGQGATEPEQLKDQLQLALAWNRSDIAAEKILLEDITWETGSLDSIMTKALMDDKVDFVKLLMQNGVVMQEYLTVSRLEELYNKAPTMCHFRDIAKKPDVKHSGRHISLMEVSRLLTRFLGTQKDTFYRDIVQRHTRLHRTESVASNPGNESDEAEAADNTSFSDPNKELFIWAVLLNKQELAKFIWERCDNAIPAALAAACIFRGMASLVPSYDSELHEDHQLGMREFEELAIHLANECFESDNEKACMLMEQRHASWGYKNCLDMAALGDNRKFLATQVSQTVLNKTWKRGILSSNATIFLSVFLPPLIFSKVRYDSMGIEDGNALTLWQKLFTFYRAPCTKYVTNTLFYFSFLMLYSYMVLFDMTTSLTPGPTEIAVWLWNFAMVCECCWAAFYTTHLTIGQRIAAWFKQSVWNKIDLFKLVIALVCFGLRLCFFYLPSSNVADSSRLNIFEAAKYFYALNIVLMYLSLLRSYSASSRLGPYLLIISKMCVELSFFILVLAIPVTAYGVAVQGLLYENQQPNWVTIKEVFYIPYMQIFGIADAKYYSGDVADGCNGTAGYLKDGTYCPGYTWPVFVLLAAYLLIVNVLLLNLLIAVFNNIYNVVSENSLQIWKFDMFYLVEEYDKKPVLPAPLIIFELAVLSVLKILKKGGCRSKTKDYSYKEQHTDLLRIFEKEMLQRYLTRTSEEAANTVETKVSNILRSSKDISMTLQELSDTMQQLQQAELEDYEQTGPRADGDASLKGESRWPSPAEVKMAQAEDDMWKKASIKVLHETKESQKEMENSLKELDAVNINTLARRRMSLAAVREAGSERQDQDDDASPIATKRRIRTKDRLKYLEEKMELQDKTIKESLKNIEELLKSTILGRGIVDGDGVLPTSRGQLAAAAAAGAQAASAIEFSNMEQKKSYD